MTLYLSVLHLQRERRPSLHSAWVLRPNWPPLAQYRASGTLLCPRWSVWLSSSVLRLASLFPCWVCPNQSTTSHGPSPLWLSFPSVSLSPPTLASILSVPQLPSSPASQLSRLPSPSLLQVLPHPLHDSQGPVPPASWVSSDDWSSMMPPPHRPSGTYSLVLAGLTPILLQPPQCTSPPPQVCCPISLPGLRCRH